MKRYYIVLLFLFIANALFAQERIPMNLGMGKYSIPCEVNGLTLNFRFDSNLSTALISQIDASFMLKNRYISKDDVSIKGKMSANGTIPEKSTIIIRSIKIGSKEITNILATVTSETETSLTLGKLAISQIGQYSIDGRYLTLGNPQPTPPIFNTRTYLTSPKDTTIYYPNSQSTYTGQVLNGIRNGFGTMTWQSGDKYVGNWDNGFRKGKGTYFWPDGDKYEGNWDNNKTEGYGTYYWKNGNKYSGEWRNDKREGQGEMKYTDGVYKGAWRDGKRNGYGVFESNDGNKYAGNYVNDSRDGYGVYYWSNGNKYEGNWSENKRSGKGKMTYSDGVYDGEWSEGKRDGYGVFKTNDGNMYSGYYKNDKPEGYGVYTWKSGDKYEGYYKNGLRDGQGTYTWTSGNKYVGEWREGKQNGKGVYYYASGKTKRGIWKNGEYDSAYSYSDDDSCNSSESYDFSDNEVDYYIAQTKTTADLYSSPSLLSEVTAKIPQGSYVFMSTSDSGKSYRKVIYVDKDLDGYVLASNLTNFTKVDVDESGNLEVKTRTYKSTADIEITNSANVTATITIGSKSYKLAPNEKKTIKDLAPGTYKITASSPGVLPFVGKDVLKAGYVYTWKFYLTTEYK